MWTPRYWASWRWTSRETWPTTRFRASWSRAWAAPWISTVGAKIVVAATEHFDKSGASKLLRRCRLPLTAANQVDYVCTDIGFFQVKNGAFVLKEYFKPYTVDFILEKTDADIVVDKDCREIDLL